MIRYSLILMFFFFEYHESWCQIKEYKLVSSTARSDFNYTVLANFDTIKTMQGRREVFNPVKGTFTLYTFIATYKGLSFDNTEKEFHDILVLKVDVNNFVVDAYQYTLEWAEPPFSMDLYRASIKGMTLKDGLSIKKMKFRSADYSINSRDTLNEEGSLRL